MKKEDIFDKIMNLPILNIFNPFYKKHKEALLYLFFGGVSFFLNMTMYFAFINIYSMNVLIANMISWIIIVAFCFVTNKIWVFDNKETAAKSLATQLLSFYASRLFTFGAEELILFVFIEKLNYNNLAIKLIAQIIVIISNYILSKLIVFRKENKQ